MTSDDRNASPLVPEATSAAPGPGGQYGTFDPEGAASLETGNVGGAAADAAAAEKKSGLSPGDGPADGHGVDIKASRDLSEFTCFQLLYVGAIMLKCSVMGAVHVLSGGASTVPCAVGLGLVLQGFPWDGHFTWDGLTRRKKGSPPKSERIHFLDNLKVFVLQVCISYEALQGYAGVPNNIAESLGASPSGFRRFAFAFIWIGRCIVPLLFLISGYFAPPALELLGPAYFVRDRLQRYGKPLIAYFVSLSTWGWIFSMLVIGRETNTLVGSAGLSWVLEVLIIFHLIYAVFPSPSISSDLPSQWRICLAGLILGLLQGILVKENFTYENVPIQPSSLPFYIVFFIVGIVARRSDWLSEIRNLRPGQLAVAFSATVACALLLAALVAPMADSVAQLEDGQLLLAGYYLPWYRTLAMHALSGVLTTASSVVLLNFFARYLNFTNRLLTVLSQAAYGVLIFFNVTLVFVQYSYELILTGHGVGFTFENVQRGQWVSTTPLEPRLLFLGWLYSLGITCGVLYPLCYNTIKMPGVRVCFS